MFSLSREGHRCPSAPPQVPLLHPEDGYGWQSQAHRVRPDPINPSTPSSTSGAFSSRPLALSYPLISSLISSPRVSDSHSDVSFVATLLAVIPFYSLVRPTTSSCWVSSTQPANHPPSAVLHGLFVNVTSAAVSLLLDDTTTNNLTLQSYSPRSPLAAAATTCLITTNIRCFSSIAFIHINPHLPAYTSISLPLRRRRPIDDPASVIPTTRTDRPTKFDPTFPRAAC